MRFFKLLLFFIIPSLILHPLQAYERPSYHEIIAVFQKETALIKRITVNGIPHFDLIISLIEDIENDNIDEDIDIQELNEFLVLLLRFGFQGTQEEWEALERDNKALLEGTYGDDEDYEEDDLSFTYGYSGEIVLCGGVIKKGAKAVKKTGKAIKKGAKDTYGYVKDHKKEAIIIAAGVIGVAVLGAVVLPALAGAAATTALDSSSSDHKKHDSNPSKVEALSDSSHVYAAIEEPHARDIVQERIETIREEINAEPSTDPDPSILDKARELGSYIAHQVLDGASEIISPLPDAFDKVKEFQSYNFPEDQISRNENFENLITKGHQIIDDAFSTDLAKHFSHEDQETGFENDWNIGILPPPGAIQPNSTKGWKVGEPIPNLTSKGNIPKWDTVRQRYWKDKALSHPKNYILEDLERMKKGLAPQRLNREGQLESKELHHIPSQKEGGLFDVVEVWPDEHAALDPYRKLKKE